jgi:hypothetical protein
MIMMGHTLLKIYATTLHRKLSIELEHRDIRDKELEGF